MPPPLNTDLFGELKESPEGHRLQSVVLAVTPQHHFSDPRFEKNLSGTRPYMIWKSPKADGSATNSLVAVFY